MSWFHNLRKLAKNINISFITIFFEIKKYAPKYMSEPLDECKSWLDLFRVISKEDNPINKFLLRKKNFN